MALTELIQFPMIPIKVTMNEYIEMSKIFSTPKSKLFINGLLDKLVDDLKEEKKIRKKGRGLI
jgi:N utilization substance protein B